MSKNSQHVAPNDGKWSVRKSGSSRASKTVDTQKEAIEIATARARKVGGEVYVHGRDGRIREQISCKKGQQSTKG